MFYLSTREVEVYSDVNWWDDGHVEQAQQAVIDIARRELEKHEDFVHDAPNVSRDHMKDLWKFTWVVITMKEK